MKQSSRAFLCAALICGFICAAALAPAPQSWRSSALASFDDAWQTINDTFYDPTFGGVDWAAVKVELRPRVETAASMDDARDVIRQMLARLKKSHFQLLAPSRKSVVRGPAIGTGEFRVLNREVVVTPDQDRVRRGIGADDVEGATGGNTKTAALAGRESPIAVVRPNRHSLRVDDVTGLPA